jgi:hypothetical protein
MKARRPTLNNKKCPQKQQCQLNSAPINPIKTNIYSRLSILHLTEAVAKQTAKLRRSPWRCKAARDASGVSGRWATGPAVARWRTGAMKGWKKKSGIHGTGWDVDFFWWTWLTDPRDYLLWCSHSYELEMSEVFLVGRVFEKGSQGWSHIPIFWSKSPEAELGSWH